MPQIVLGPMLRYVGGSEATIWLESDGPCEVEILGARTRTFEVEGHHFALVVIGDLQPAGVYEYEVLIDRKRAWPLEGSDFPASAIRTLDDGERLRITFGSCRVAAPQEPPYTLPPTENPSGFGTDALRAFALRARDRPPAERPDLLLLTGDQAYSCEAAPETRAFIRSRRDVRRPPGEEVADFEEYTWLYRESWSEPAVRWLLSAVPSAMLFCDHDVCEDWNTSEAWVEEMRRTDWWEERVTSALMAYWLYQHLGNLAPEALLRDEVFASMSPSGDNGPALRSFARRATQTVDGRQFSYARELGGTRLVALDTRTGRVLTGGERLMIDERAWEWVKSNARGDCDHLLLVSSLPFVLPAGMHALEAWDEAISAGAWGPRLAPLGERLRRRLSLEHWPAFQASFHRFVELLEEVADGRRGSAPATITGISGDLHQGYVAEIQLHGAAGAGTRAHQLVCSPLRNPVASHERRAIGAVNSAAGRRLLGALARRAGVRAPRISWHLRAGPVFENQIATLDLDGRRAHVVIERAAGNGSVQQLETTMAAQLTSGEET